MRCGRWVENWSPRSRETKRRAAHDGGRPPEVTETAAFAANPVYQNSIDLSSRTGSSQQICGDRAAVSHLPMDNAKPSGRPRDRVSPSPAGRLPEPFAPVPLWLLWKWPDLPAADQTITAVLFAHHYGSLPRAGALCLVEIARLAKLSEDRARRAVLRRQAAGWVEQNSEGKFQLSQKGALQAPEGEILAGKERRPVEYLIVKTTPMPAELSAAWSDFLDVEEQRIIFHLMNETWNHDALDSPDVLPEPDSEDAQNRSRRALARLLAMETIWRIESPGDSSAAPLYRLNPYWHRQLEEP